LKKVELMQFLEENGLDFIEEVERKGNLYIFKFKYVFDSLELEGAESYANEESNKENDDAEWLDEYYLPYLNDIAIDNVEDIMEDALEEFDLNYEFVSFELSSQEDNYIDFVVVFSKDDIDVNIDDLILEM
jgi:hypothetical protein